MVLSQQVNELIESQHTHATEVGRWVLALRINASRNIAGRRSQPESRLPASASPCYLDRLCSARVSTTTGEERCFAYENSTHDHLLQLCKVFVVIHIELFSALLFHLAHQRIVAKQ